MIATLTTAHERLDTPRPAVRLTAVLLHALFLGLFWLAGWWQSLQPVKPPPVSVSLVSPAQLKQLERESRQAEQDKPEPPPKVEPLPDEPEIGEAPPPPPPPPTPPKPAVTAVEKPPAPPPKPPAPTDKPAIKPPEKRKPEPPPPPQPTAAERRAERIKEMRRSLRKPAKPTLAALKPGAPPKINANDIKERLMAGVPNPVVTPRFASGAAAAVSSDAAAEFFSALKAELDSRWREPSRAEVGGATPRVLVRLVILNDGTVKVASVARASGVGAMDASVRQLIAALQKLRSSPRQFNIAASQLEVEVAFELD
ncbi:MAG: TonB family protein [Lentisphaeria bacterium]|jgi:TonB family protein